MRALVMVMGVLGIPVVSGCGLVPGMGCDSPDDAVVEELMSHAKSDFMYGESRIARLEFDDAAQAELPEEMRRYGATHVVVIRAASYLADPVSDDLGGAVGNNTFVVDADGHPIGPIGLIAPKQFELQAPDEPGWSEWAERVDGSSVAIDLRRCVK